MVWMKTESGTVRKPFKPTPRRIERESRLQREDVAFLICVVAVLAAHFMSQIVFT